MAHCLLLPYPVQGHLNPMLQFAKRLIHKRVKITLALTKFLIQTNKEVISGGSISVGAISDGFDEGGREQAKSAEEYLTIFQLVGQETLAELLQNIANSGCPVDCVIYDPFLPWVLDVAKRFGLTGAAFFTQSCAVDSIYYRVYTGDLKLPLSTGSETPAVVVPGLPPLKSEDMPSFIHDYGSHPASFRMLANQFRNFDKVDWILVNTFSHLEEKVIDWMKNFWRVKAVGPTIPSMYLDKRLQDDKEYGVSMFKLINNGCLKWLGEQKPRSVVYVSFGSLAKLSWEQTQELAWALTTCNKPFLWVVRSSEQAKLPENFSNEASTKGLIVSWCPQLDVLAHEALGCFITHCGWNSTLEGLSLGVPMVTMPQWSDQSTNAKFVVDVWKVGVRAWGNDEGLVSREEIVSCVQHVMDGEDGKEIGVNALKWKEMAREAVDEGGSSDSSIEEFVCSLGNKIDNRTGAKCIN